MKDFFTLRNFQLCNASAGCLMTASALFRIPATEAVACGARLSVGTRNGASEINTHTRDLLGNP